MNSQELRLELVNQGNRLNHVRAETQRLDREWTESKKLEAMQEGAVQTLQYLLKNAEAAEKAGLAAVAEMEARGEITKIGTLDANGKITPISEGQAQ